MDETTATPEVIIEPVEAPTAPTAAKPQPADPRRIARTVEVVKDDPAGQKLLAEPLGWITPEQLQEVRLQDAREAAIEAFEIPADKHKFIVGDTPAEIRQAAKEIHTLLQPAATTATKTTQPTAEPAPNAPLSVEPIVTPPVSIKSKEDAVAAYTALGIKVG